MTGGVPRCDELRLRIALGPIAGREVAVFGLDGSPASGASMLLFGETQVENVMLRVGRRRSMRSYGCSQIGEAKPLGSNLFDRSVAARVRDVYFRARHVLDPNGRAL